MSAQRVRSVAVVAAILLTSRGPAAQTRSTIAIAVTDSAGLRRTEYPVRAAVPLPRDAVPDSQHTVLRAGDSEQPAQYTVAERWPDGSVKQIDIDFNVSLAPGEVKTFALAYGADARPQSTPRGLAVTEDGDTIQVGNIRFKKNGVPLIASANYRGELIASDGDARNGIAVPTQAGAAAEPTE